VRELRARAGGAARAPEEAQGAVKQALEAAAEPRELRELPEAEQSRELGALDEQLPRLLLAPAGGRGGHGGVLRGKKDHHCCEVLACENFAGFDLYRVFIYFAFVYFIFFYFRLFFYLSFYLYFFIYLFIYIFFYLSILFIYFIYLFYLYPGGYVIDLPVGCCVRDVRAGVGCTRVAHFVGR
jgi:hypothetical protein